MRIESWFKQIMANTVLKYLNGDKNEQDERRR